MKEFFQRRLVEPLIALLKQGTTPEKIALSIAFGLVLGIFPALGWTTLLCFLAALAFRLNLPAIQLVNYFVYPLQLILLIPFIRAGELLFRSPRLPLSATQIVDAVKSHPAQAIKLLWISNVHAVAVWALLAPLAICLFYLLLRPAMLQLAYLNKVRRNEAPQSAAIKTRAVLP